MQRVYTMHSLSEVVAETDCRSDLQQNAKSDMLYCFGQQAASAKLASHLTLSVSPTRAAW